MHRMREFHAVAAVGAPGNNGTPFAGPVSFIRHLHELLAFIVVTCAVCRRMLKLFAFR